MRVLKILQIVGLAILVAVVGQTAYAFDLSGAWTNNASACKKIFELNKGNTLKIVGGSGIYGDAFIIRNNSIVSPTGKCTIDHRKTHGGVTHLVATCAAGNVALSTFEFSYRVKDNNTIVRIFPGIEELNVTYHRCTL